MNKVTGSPRSTTAHRPHGRPGSRGKHGPAAVLAAVLLAAPAVTVAVPAAAAAEPATVEEYQVKLRLDDSIVTADWDLTDEAADYFGISPDDLGAPDVEQSVYVDTPGTDFADAGWSLRLRHKADAKDFDLTYKYRAPLGDNSLSADSVDDALAAAKDNNFDGSDDNYDPQVNASFTTSTLDFSNKKSTGCDDDCDIPDGQDVVDLLDDKLPGKFEKATGTTLTDSDAEASQTVTQRSWPVRVPTGDSNGDSIDAELEVTAMSGGYFVEITTETDDRSDAADIRSALTSALDDREILRHDDAFKTGLVLGGTL